MMPLIPQLKLEYQVNPGEPIEYFLESTLVFEQENYSAGGHRSVPLNLNAEGRLSIELLLVEENVAPGEQNGPSTVVHTVPLGSLNLASEDFEIEVSVYTQGGKLKGKGHVRRADAREIGKPIIEV